MKCLLSGHSCAKRSASVNSFKVSLRGVARRSVLQASSTASCATIWPRNSPPRRSKVYVCSGVGWAGSPCAPNCACNRFKVARALTTSRWHRRCAGLMTKVVSGSGVVPYSIKRSKPKCTVVVHHAESKVTYRVATTTIKGR